MKTVALLSLAFTIPFLVGTSGDSAARTRTAKVHAAHIIAYASLAQKPEQLSEDSFEDVIEEDPETGGPYSGPIDSKAAEIIDAAVERAMERSGFTWEELRRLAITVGKVNAAFSSKEAKQPAIEAQFVMLTGPGCDACETFKKAVFPGLLASKWTVGKYGEPVKIAVLSIDDYDSSSLRWGLVGSDGQYTVPQFVIVRGGEVVSRGKLQKAPAVPGQTSTKLEIITDVGVKPMTATAVGDWINGFSK